MGRGASKDAAALDAAGAATGTVSGPTFGRPSALTPLPPATRHEVRSALISTLRASSELIGLAADAAATSLSPERLNCIRLVLSYCAPNPPLWVVIGGQIRYGTESQSVEVLDLSRPVHASTASSGAGRNVWLSGPDTMVGHGARPAVAIVQSAVPGSTAVFTKLYVCGGSLVPEQSTFVECLDLSTHTGTGSVASLLVAGDDPESIDSDAPQWMRCADMHTGRRYACAVSASGQLCVVGGVTTRASGGDDTSAPPAGEYHLNSLEVYDEAENEWRVLPASASMLHGRSMFALVSTGRTNGNKLVAIGGLTNAPAQSAAKPAATAAAGGDSKSKTGPARFDASGKLNTTAPAAAVDQKHVVAAVEIFDPSTQRWSVLNELPAGRYLCTADTMDGGRMIVVCGGCGSTPGGHDAQSVLWCRPFDAPSAGTTAAPAWHEIKNMKLEVFQHTSAVVNGAVDTGGWAAAALLDELSAASQFDSATTADPPLPTQQLLHTVFTIGGTRRIEPTPAAPVAASAVTTPKLKPPQSPEEEEKALADAIAASTAPAPAAADPPFSRGVSYRVDLPKHVLLASAIAAIGGDEDTTAAVGASPFAGPLIPASFASRACRVCIGPGSAAVPQVSLNDPKYAAKITIYSQPLPHLTHGRWAHASVLVDQF